MSVCRFRTPLPLTLLVLVGFGCLPRAAWGQDDMTAQRRVTGTLEVVVVDAPGFRSTRHDYFLRDERTRRLYELRFGTLSPDRLRHGARVSVRGVAAGRALHVDSVAAASDPGITPIGDDPMPEPLPDGPPPDAPDPGAPTLTLRRAVVLMVDMTDAKASSRYTTAQIAANLYTGTQSMDGLYRETSLGQLGFAADSDGDARPDVFGPLAIPYAGAASCNYYDWAYAAEAAAERAGIDLSRYQHRVFALPHYSGLPLCNWAGVANVGCGTFCRAWIAESESPMVFAHELGHNLSMAHAGTDPGNDGAIDLAYGDQSDPMGNSRAWRRFNGAHVHQLGWLGAFPGSFLPVTASGTYTIAEIGAPASSALPRTLRLRKPDSGDYYYLSYREPTGYDGGLALAYQQRVSVHRYTGSGYAATSLITSLTDGGSFTDAANGIVVRQVSHGAGTATVSITVPATSTTCAAGVASVSFASATTYALPGGSVSLGTSVRNGDGTDCPATTFTLSYGGTPAAALAPGTMTLTGGQTGSASLSVAIPTTEGAYTLQVRAADSDGVSPSHTTATGSSTVVVDGTAPSVPSGLRATVAQRSIDLSWSASSDTAAGVAGYTILRNGVVYDQTTALTYSDTRVSSGVSYTYSVVARDRAGNVSAAAPAVSATASTKSGGRKR